MDIAGVSKRLIKGKNKEWNSVLNLTINYRNGSLLLDLVSFLNFESFVSLLQLIINSPRMTTGDKNRQFNRQYQFREWIPYNYCYWSKKHKKKTRRNIFWRVLIMAHRDIKFSLTSPRHQVHLHIIMLCESLDKCSCRSTRLRDNQWSKRGKKLMNFCSSCSLLVLVMAVPATWQQSQQASALLSAFYPVPVPFFEWLMKTREEEAAAALMPPTNHQPAVAMHSINFLIMALWSSSLARRTGLHFQSPPRCVIYVAANINGVELLVLLLLFVVFLPCLAIPADLVEEMMGSRVDN